MSISEKIFFDIIFFLNCDANAKNKNKTFVYQLCLLSLYLFWLT